MKKINNVSISEGIRYWRIDREQPYGDSQQRVDICVKRYVLNESENELEPLDPVFIEAKRARRWQSKISDATIISKPYSINEVREDICKLRNEKMKKQECGITIHSHLLIWNIYEGFDDHVDTFFKRLGDAKVSVHQVRWLPISWDFPKVSKWLWIALAEVE